jgi:hypothetical protein
MALAQRIDDEQYRKLASDMNLYEKGISLHPLKIRTSSIF